MSKSQADVPNAETNEGTLLRMFCKRRWDWRAADTSVAIRCGLTRALPARRTRRHVAITPAIATRGRRIV